MDTYHPTAVVVRIRGASMAPGQRDRRGGRQGGGVASTRAVGVAVAVAGQHHVPKVLLAVVKGAVLHLDVTRAVRHRQRGCVQLQSASATAARVRVRWGSDGRRVHILICNQYENWIRNSINK